MSKKPVRDYAVHPVAALLPMMSPEEYDGLRDDIAENGQLDPVMIRQGVLIDGRNRLQACRELGIEPEVQELDSAVDPVSWIISHNVHRRHLSTGQRGMFADDMATMKPGENRLKNSAALIQAAAQDEAAKLLNVSRSTVQAAAKVKAEATPEVIAAVKAGTMTLSAAVKTTKPKKPKTPEKKAAEKAAKAAKKEKAKADKAAEKLKIKAENDAAKLKAKQAAAAAKAAAKLAVLPKEEQAKAIKNMIQQHIDKAVRLIDDLARVRPVSNASKMEIIRTLQGIKLW